MSVSFSQKKAFVLFNFDIEKVERKEIEYLYTQDDHIIEYDENINLKEIIGEIDPEKVFLRLIAPSEIDPEISIEIREMKTRFETDRELITRLYADRKSKSTRNHND